MSLKCLLSKHSQICGHSFSKFLITSSSLKSSPFLRITASRYLQAAIRLSMPKIYSRAIRRFYSSDWLLKQARFSWLEGQGFSCWDNVLEDCWDYRSVSSFLIESESQRSYGMEEPRMGRFQTFPLASSTSLLMISSQANIFIYPSCLSPSLSLLLAASSGKSELLSQYDKSESLFPLSASQTSNYSVSYLSSEVSLHFYSQVVYYWAVVLMAMLICQAFLCQDFFWGFGLRRTPFLGFFLDSYLLVFYLFFIYSETSSNLLSFFYFYGCFYLGLAFAGLGLVFILLAGLTGLTLDYFQLLSSSFILLTGSEFLLFTQLADRFSTCFIDSSYFSQTFSCDLGYFTKLAQSIDFFLFHTEPVTFFLFINFYESYYGTYLGLCGRFLIGLGETLGNFEGIAWCYNGVAFIFIIYAKFSAVLGRGLLYLVMTFFFTGGAFLPQLQGVFALASS